MVARERSISARAITRDLAKASACMRSMSTGRKSNGLPLIVRHRISRLRVYHVTADNPTRMA